MIPTTLGRCFLTLGRVAIVDKTQVNNGNGPPSIKIVPPTIIDDANPTNRRARFDVNVEGNCEIINKLADDINIIESIDASRTTLFKSCQQK